jgi:hypothetical protein
MSSLTLSLANVQRERDVIKRGLAWVLGMGEGLGEVGGEE